MKTECRLHTESKMQGKHRFKVQNKDRPTDKHNTVYLLLRSKPQKYANILKIKAVPF